MRLLQAPGSQAHVRRFKFDADEPPAEPDARDAGGAATHEGIEDNITRLAAGEDDAFKQGDGFLSWVLAEYPEGGTPTRSSSASLRPSDASACSRSSACSSPTSRPR